MPTHELAEDGHVVASCTWTAWPRQPGVVQLLDTHVEEGRRRQGLGGRVLSEAIGRMDRPRRLVAMVDQPEVVVRAWLQRNGFVHVHTLTNLSGGDTETMVLVRTFE